MSDTQEPTAPRLSLVPSKPTRSDTPHRTLEAVAAELDDLGAAQDAFLTSFPEEERHMVLLGMYLDADGEFRTTHRMLISADEEQTQIVKGAHPIWQNDKY